MDISQMSKERSWYDRCLRVFGHKTPLAPHWKCFWVAIALSTHQQPRACGSVNQAATKPTANSLVDCVDDCP